MIEIFFPRPQGCHGTLEVSGHAEYGEKGKDIICAGISSLVLTYLGGLETHMSAEISGEIQEGNCNVKTLVPPEKEVPFGEVYRVFRSGFQRFSKTYPNNVRFKE